MPQFQYPVIGIVDRGSTIGVYVAWEESDLVTCPLHEHLRTRHAEHTLIDAAGSTVKVSASRLAGFDWQRARAIGLGAQAVSALFSFGNVPVRLRHTYVSSEPLALDELRTLLRHGVSQQPQRYTATRSERAINAELNKARTFSELASAVSPQPPQ